MANALGFSVELRARFRETASSATTIPWYAWAAVLAATCVAVGLYWDISWHRSIGRDTFWTPAHLLIQVCAVLAGFSSAYLIFSTTFGSDVEARQHSVAVWGFRGPLGAFVAAWGGLTMITSAPFDNWWHNAYGLDVEILSPPHVLLAMGITAIEWGGVLLVLARMNRAQGLLRRKLEWMLLYLGGIVVVLDLMLKLEYLQRPLMHSAVFYLVVCLGLPFLLVGLARATLQRWSMTIMVAVYSIFELLLLWFLPLFPAQPKLGPVYQHIMHMVPLTFPLLLIIPAPALDLLLPRVESWNRWMQALAIGTVFLAVFLAAQWPFADFLMSPFSRNWVFGTNYFSYYQSPDSPSVRNVFLVWEVTAAHFWRNLGLAFFAAVVSARVGVTWGAWLRRLRC